MRALLTGATGFVGANLARRLLRDGHHVVLLVRPNHQSWRIADIADQVEIREVDLADEHAAMREVGGARPDWVFHLAAHGAYPTQKDVREMVRTNMLSTINLVEAALAAGCDTFVNAGSSSEYGLKDHAPRENECPEPNSHYAVTKVSASMYCQHIGRSRNARVFTLRLYSVYGPFEEPARLMPTLIVRGLAGRLPPLVRPETARDYIYTDDVVEAFVRMTQVRDLEPGGIFNLGTGVQTSLRTAVETARRVLGIKPEPEWGTMDGRIWDTDVWVADNHKICSALNWRPAYSFEQGFTAMADWMRGRADMLRFYESRLAGK